MTRENLKIFLQTVEGLLADQKYDDITVIISGGEPTLVLNNYLDLILSASSKIEFMIITNGSNIKSSWVKKINKKNIFTKISFDGLNPLHAKKTIKGKNLTQSVLKGIKLFQKLNVPFTTNTVLNENWSAEDIDKLIDWAATNKIEELGLAHSDAEDDIEKVPRIIALYERAIKRCIEKEFFNIKLCNLIIYDDLLTYGNCAAGRRFISVNPDLQVNSCHKKNTPNLGLFNAGISETLLKDENKKYYNHIPPKRCISCDLLAICKGGCLQWWENEKLFNTQCEIKKRAFDIIENNNFIQLAQRNKTVNL
jgi:radical SAM protein with 4Fe4S-binding SPASM domain